MATSRGRVASLGAFVALLFVPGEAGSCSHLNAGSGPWVCDTDASRCQRHNGWGSPSDIALYKSPDCSSRACPADRAWVDVPTGPTTAHAVAECSNMGRGEQEQREVPLLRR
jgi:hypothetical protein